MRTAPSLEKSLGAHDARECREDISTGHHTKSPTWDYKRYAQAVTQYCSLRRELFYLFNAFIFKSRTTSKLNPYPTRLLVECVNQKRKPSIELGFVKMGDKRLRQQPPAILLMIGLTNKDRGPYRLIRRHDHRSDLFIKQLPRFLILNKSPDFEG